MDGMTPDEIRLIEERCSKATPGPIGVERTKAMNWIGPMRRSGVKVAAIIFHNDRNFLRDEVLAQRDADADYLVAIWNAGPALVQEVKRLTEELLLMTAGREQDNYEKQEELAVLRADNARLQSENDEWNCIFDLTHAAQARALLRWREQDPEGRRLKLPNIEDHTIWCFERIETLTADNARLREDGERLDWLSGEGRVARFTTGWEAWRCGEPCDTPPGLSIREAIDDAMKARAALANDSEKLKGS